MDEMLRSALEGRTAAYGLLARLLNREVDEELLAELRALPFVADEAVRPNGVNDTSGPDDPGRRDNAADLPTAAHGADLDEGNRLMGGYLAGIGNEGGDAQRALTDLAVDFARLFVVRKRSESAAPYPNESVHTSKEHLRMDGARDEVRSLFRAEGVRAADAWRLGEDHVALELEFMQTLAARTAEAASANDEETADDLLSKQASFLDRHLLNWVPAFAEAMGRTARTDFYRGVALLLVAHLREDRALVKQLLG